MAKALPRVLRHNLKKALTRKRLDEAGDLLLRLKAEAPLDRETRGFELEYLIGMRRDPEAASLAEQLRRAYPDSSRIQFLSGKLAYVQKRYQDAVDFFRESNRLFDHWQSQHWLGKALTQAGALDEALPILESVVEINPRARIDLAWLYFRRNDLDRALAAYERELAENPSSRAARESITRVKAAMLAPERLVEEIDTLAEFGEEPPPHLLAEYVKKLFETGDSNRAREVVRKRAQDLDAWTGTDVAWKCYKAQAFDLALDLFLRFFEKNYMNYKFLNSLEIAAKKCHRSEELLPVYEAYAPRAEKFYGRGKKIAALLAKKEDPE